MERSLLIWLIENKSSPLNKTIVSNFTMYQLESSFDSYLNDIMEAREDFIKEPVVSKVIEFPKLRFKE